MRTAIVTLIVALGLMSITGCASEQEQARTKSGEPHAECLVCKANADLACVDIPVDASTPSYVHEGKTYYFCSNECRNDFVKNPAKYAAFAKK